MNKHTKKTRKNRRRSSARSRRMLPIVNMLIAVVAIIECIMLVVFATYSWIESTSSLIISTGEGGEVSMNVGKNLNYQVEIAADSAVPANMQDYYHSVKYFHFAKASSPDGVDMYFPKTNATNTANNNNGYNAVSGYRKGDTADININYLYFDFKLKNSTSTQKDFYFKAGSAGNLFTATGGSAEDNTAVAKAMRISFVEGNASPKIYSIGNGSSETGTSETTGAVHDRSGTTTPAVTSYFVKKSEYDVDKDNQGQPQDSNYRVLMASPNDTSEVSVRIWLEEKALVGVTADELKAISVTINLSLVSDNIKYQQIFFDDYSYTDSPYPSYRGKHSTDVPGSNTMYLYAYNSSMDDGSYVSYRMTRVANTNDNTVPRWATSVPVDAVLDHLTNASSSYYQNAFFGYGVEPATQSASGYNGTLSSQPLYMWKLPGAIRLITDPEDPNGRVLDASTQYVTALGIARAKNAYGTHESIEGYCTYMARDLQGNPVNPELVRFHDYATGLTGISYNQNGPGVQNYRYITASNKTTTYIPGSTAESQYDFYYFDLPAGTDRVIFNNNGTGLNQTENIDISGFTSGTCYYIPTPSTSGKQTASVYTVPQGITLPNSGSRIYFYNSVEWTNLRIYCFDSSDNVLSSNWPGDEMTLYVPEVADPGSSVTYMNYNLYITGASNAASSQAVNMVYDAAGDYYKAYVPVSWLTGNMYFKYYKAGYYDFSGVTDYASIIWNAARSGSASHDYNALGYNNDVLVNDIGVGANINLTGAGTWDAVREISFSTELIDDTISGQNKYYVSSDNSNYYLMYPSPDLLKFTAYVADNGVQTQLYFKRAVPGENDTTVETTWNPIAHADDSVFYPVSDSTGYFHVAVLVDATFDQLITSIRSDVDGDPSAQNYSDPDATVNSTLTYSKNNGTATNLFPNAIGDNRWYVPCDSDNDVVTFTWTPYDYVDANTPDTSFTYSCSPRYGIYCVVTE